MWGTRKISKLSLVIVCNSYDWSKSMNTKKLPFKITWTSFYCVNGLPVGSYNLCVKMRTCLCGERTLPQNQRNCFPPLPGSLLKLPVDFHLTDTSIRP